MGNPVELSKPDKVCQTQQFFQYAIVSDSVIDPTHHPCLNSLPTIFFKAMKGISAMVDAYLGKQNFSIITRMVSGAGFWYTIYI